MARPIKFSKSTVKEKNIIQLGTFQVFSLPSIPGSPSMFLFVQLFPSNFLSIVWSWYTSVYGGVNFRPQIVHSHLSIDISNYRPGSYNTSVNCHKTSALLYSLYRLLVRIAGESSCAIQFDFLNQGPQDVYL